MGRPTIDLTWQRFGRLVAIRQIPMPYNIKYHTAWWELQCDCGNLHSASAGNLKNGKVKSCGCLRAEKCRETGKKNKGRENTWLKK